MRWEASVEGTGMDRVVDGRCEKGVKAWKLVMEAKTRVGVAGSEWRSSS